MSLISLQDAKWARILSTWLTYCSPTGFGTHGFWRFIVIFQGNCEFFSIKWGQHFVLFFKQCQPLILMRWITRISIIKPSWTTAYCKNDLAFGVYSLTSVDHFVDIKISYLQQECFIQPDNLLRPQTDVYFSVGVFCWPLWKSTLAVIMLLSPGLFQCNLHLIFPFNITNGMQKWTTTK